MPNKVTVSDAALREAAAEGMDAFINVFVDAINDFVGGELNTETMTLLNADQITLLAYLTLRDEVMNGGFIQLIHNGYGGFIFLNPFAKMVKQWGIIELGRLISKAHSSYKKYHEEIEKDCTDEEFMALFERFPVFDDFDDFFVEHEEEWTTAIAQYVDGHIEAFAEIVN